MSVSDVVDSLCQEWRKEAGELEDRPEEIKEQQDSFYKGSWDAARERAEPDIKRKAIEDCIEDLEESSSIDEFLESLADWRKEANELDKRILDSNEWFRKSTRRRQLEACIDEFEEAFPEDNFDECYRCGSLQVPVSDKRRSEGYRWECEECGY
ncbi:MULTISPECIES: hypothetical protein [Haloferacaceae]|uniref:hypothetical protein n=1 Tax=Haloferacaceae TaxID=1644056 RepID=UPI000F4C2C81|nr:MULTISPECIES: hypothetical protein [Haloferacales]